MLRCISAVIRDNVIILVTTMLQVEHKSQVRPSDILRRYLHSQKKTDVRRHKVTFRSAEHALNKLSAQTRILKSAWCTTKLYILEARKQTCLTLNMATYCFISVARASSCS